MRCKKVEDLLPAYTDTEGELSERQRKCIEKHLVSCALCSESAESYRQLDSLIKSLNEEEWQKVTQEDGDRIWQNILARINSQPVAKPSPMKKLYLTLFQRRPWLTPTLASALAILLLILIHPFKGKETFELEGIEVAKQDISSSIQEKSIKATEEGMGETLPRYMEEMVQLAARHLWETELEEIKAWDDRESPLLALRDTLEHLGEKVDYDYLQFASGASFHLFLHRPSLSREQEYSLETMKNASAAYGYRSQWIINQDLSSTLKTIEESIRKNRPLLTVGIEGSKGYLMIIAYNQEEESLQVKRYGQGQSSEYIWIPFPRREWQAPFYEYQAMVKMPLFILGEKGEVPSRKEVARKVLHQAIKFARGRENPDTGYYSGLAAYGKWIAILREERKPEQEITWRQGIMRVSLNPLGDIIRRNQLAHNYLILIAEEIDQEEAKEYLLAAASNYTKISTTAKELQNLLSSEAIKVDQTSSCDVAQIASENETIGAKAVTLVQDMLTSEEAGIAEIERVIKLA